MTLDISFSPQALKDIDRNCDFLDGRQLGLGGEFLEELTDALLLLREYPELGVRVATDIRRQVLRRFRYNVFYEVLDQEIRVLSIVHGRQDE